LAGRGFALTQRKTALEAAEVGHTDRTKNPGELTEVSPRRKDLCKLADWQTARCWSFFSNFAIAAGTGTEYSAINSFFAEPLRTAVP
jgi:hypothetical protein